MIHPLPNPTIRRAVAVAAALILAAGVATAQDPTYEDAVAALKAGDYAAAAKAFEGLVDKSPTWAAGFLSLGQCYYMLGRAADGRTKLEEAKSLDPKIDLYAQYNAVGQTLYNKQEYARAIAPLERALELAAPAQRSAIATRLAHADLKLERYAEARRLLEGQQGLDARARYNLAVACQQLGDYDAALATLRSLSESGGPDTRDVLKSLSRWSHYWALKPGNEARRTALLKQAATDTRGWAVADPTSDEALRYHADVLLAAGRYGDVEALALPRAEGDHGDCAARGILARAYNEQRRSADAEAWARKELACASGSVDGRLELVVALLRQVREDFSSTADVEADLQRVEEARKVVERARALAPDNDQARGLVKDVHTALDRLQGVAADLKANDDENAAAAERLRQQEILGRCRDIHWRLRDDTQQVSAEDRAFYDEHDCKQRTTQSTGTR